MAIEGKISRERGERECDGALLSRGELYEEGDESKRKRRWCLIR